MTDFALSKRLFCALMLLVGALFASVQAAHATTGQAALDRFVRFANFTELLSVTYENAEQNGTSLTVNGLEIIIEGGRLMQLLSETFDIELPEEAADFEAALQYRITLESAVIDGLRDRGTAIEIAAFDAPSIDIMIGTQGPAPARTTYTGVSVQDLAVAKWPFFRLSRDKPISQFAPFLLALADLNLSMLTIESVETRNTVEQGVRVRQTYGDVRVGPTVGGDVSTFDAANFTMTTQTRGPDAPPPVLVTAQAMSARDYNYGTMLRALLSGEPAQGGPQTAIGRVQMDRLAFSVPGGDVSVAIRGIELTGVDVTPINGNLLERIDIMVIDAMDGVDEPDERDIIEMVGTFYGAFSLGRFQLEGLRARAPSDGSAPNAVDMARLTIADLSADGLGEISIDDLALTGPNGEDVQIGRYAFEGIGFPPLAALMDLERAVLEDDVASILKALPTLQRIVQNGVVVIVPDEGTDFSLASSTLEMDGHIGSVPTQIRTDIQQMRINLEALDPQERETFDQLGLDEITTDAQAQVSWRRDTTDVDLNFLVDVDQLGSLTGEGVIGNIPAIVFDEPSQVSLFALLGATLNSFALRYEDAGAVERAIVANASQEGLGYEAMELRWKGMVPVLLSELDDAELAGEIADALTAVIERGAPFAISATAMPPLPLAALSASRPAALARLFEFQVENR